MKQTVACAVLISALASGHAFAMKAPKLPASAKKLDGKGIVTLYDGATVSFNNFTKSRPLTGTLTYDFKANTETGTYAYGDNKGDFKGTIRIVDDKICYKTEKLDEVCVDVYTDGKSIFEVNAKKVVTSENKKQ